MLEETTTTDTQVEETAGETPQVETTPEAPAEAPVTQTQTDQQPDHADWLRNKGIDPSDPDAVNKAAEAWRTAEQEFHKGRQTKSELGEQTEAATRDLAGDDPVLARMSVLENRQIVRDFYDTNPGAKDMDAEMAEIVKAKPYLAQDLDAVYALATKAKHDTELAQAREAGRNEAKAQIAKASIAGTPHGNASTSTGDKSAEEERLERFSKW